MSDQETAFPSPPVEPPVDPLFSHAASPFMRTEAPAPVAVAGAQAGGITPISTWVTYKTQIQFGFAILAYLMILVGSITVVQANGEASWRYLIAVLPVAPAGIVIWLTVRALSRLDEVQKRTQMQALGFSLAATGLLTFGYGFLEAVGLPHMNPTLVLPLMAALWGLGLLALNLRYRFRR
ncbi:MAG TPA: hypothetical protein VFL27_03120 [Candidatus Dormibacteraeota bacterium]|nr:hypothetical protein [Candidatus Dormibacteraeota bacterium]